jgi:hypothetical protein
VQNEQLSTISTDDVLFRIITGVGEDPWVKSPPLSITALDRDAMLPRLNEVIIKENRPLGVHELAVTKREEWVTWGRFPSCLRTCKILE